MPHTPRAQLSVLEFLGRWPAAAQAFVRHGMACVGCSMSSFDTIIEAAATYGLAPDAFLHELRHAAKHNARDRYDPPPRRSGRERNRS